MTIKKHCTRAVALDLWELTDQSLHNNDVVHELVELLRERGSSLQFLSLGMVDASPYSEDIIRELCKPPLCQTLRALHMTESLSTPDEADVNGSRRPLKETILLLASIRPNEVTTH